jgi:hypothetical protein
MMISISVYFGRAIEQLFDLYFCEHFCASLADDDIAKIVSSTCQDLNREYITMDWRIPSIFADNIQRRLTRSLRRAIRTYRHAHVPASIVDISFICLLTRTRQAAFAATALFTPLRYDLTLMIF